MSLINFIIKTVFYVTALLTPIIFFKAVSNPTTLINLNGETLLICTAFSIESVPLIREGIVLFDPHPQTVEAILALSSVNVPELINASDIQIMSKIASLNDVELKNFSNLVKLPYEMSISTITRDFLINNLATKHNTETSSEIYGLAARINTLLDYYLVSRNDTLNGFNPNKNFLKMIKKLTTSSGFNVKYFLWNNIYKQKYLTSMSLKGPGNPNFLINVCNDLAMNHIPILCSWQYNEASLI